MVIHALAWTVVQLAGRNMLCWRDKEYRTKEDKLCLGQTEVTELDSAGLSLMYPCSSELMVSFNQKWVKIFFLM